MRLRVFVVVVIVGLIAGGVAVAQQVPSLPFSPSSGGGGLTANGLQGLACLIAGGSQCTMTGQVIGAAGSQSAPSFAFVGSSNAGMYRDAPGVIGFASGAVGRVLISSAGLYPKTANGIPLGLDNTPFSRIDVGSGDASDPAVEVGGNNAGLYYDGGNDKLYLQGPTVVGGSLELEANAKITLDAPTQITLTSPDIKLGNSSLEGWYGPNKTSGAAAPIVQLPRTVATTPLAAPTCTSALAGALVYYDDTDDLKPATLCVCTADNLNVYNWRKTDMVSGCNF
jgi:hypothetical protein